MEPVANSAPAPNLAGPNLAANFQLYEGRIRLPKYNCQVNVFTAVSDKDAGQLVLRTFPELSSIDHDAIAEAHIQAQQAADQAYGEKVVETFMQHFGRPPVATDYQVSAIWRDDLPSNDKDQLRSLAHSATKHGRVARAHFAASKTIRRRRAG